MRSVIEARHLQEAVARERFMDAYTALRRVGYPHHRIEQGTLDRARRTYEESGDRQWEMPAPFDIFTAIAQVQHAYMDSPERTREERIEWRTRSFWEPLAQTLDHALAVLTPLTTNAEWDAHQNVVEQLFVGFRDARRLRDEAERHGLTELMAEIDAVIQRVRDMMGIPLEGAPSGEGQKTSNDSQENGP